MVWRGLGDVGHYIEPFFGSGAVLLGRPHEPGLETINDKDAYVCNFWRAVQADPEGVAGHAAWPVNENDLHARHAYLVEQGDLLRSRLEGDPQFYDVMIAGWWVWGISLWIGSGFCGGQGGWRVEDGSLLRSPAGLMNRQGRPIPNRGMGIHRQRPHLSDGGMGVHRKRPHLSDGGMGVPASGDSLGEWMSRLSARLRWVRVCSGDWQRVLGPAVLGAGVPCGVFLDPPYEVGLREPGLYIEDGSMREAIRSWCLLHGDDDRVRIVLCGLLGEYEMPTGWRSLIWRTPGGYQRGERNRDEVLWFSPHCLEVADKQLSLFEEER